MSGFFKGLSGGEDMGFRNVELWMVLPAICVLVFISVYPFVFTIRLSFMDYPMIVTRNPIFTGFKNWIRMFSDVKTRQYWMVTLKYAVGALSLEMVLGFIVALLLSKLRFLQDLFTALMTVPLFFAPVLVGLLGRFLFHESYGIYTYFLRQVGLLRGVPSIFGYGPAAFFALICLDVWEWTPLVVIILLAGLKSLPQEIFEAAQVDGITTLQEVWYLTLPLLKRVILVALLVRTMDVIKYFDHILVTTRGGPADATKTISVAVYDQAFQAYQMGYAATLTVSALVVTMVLAQLFVRFVTGRSME
jgi:multiple sugar transport system permease protein